MQRIFVAHSASTPDEQLVTLKQGIVEELEYKNPGKKAGVDFEIVLGRDDFDARGRVLGYEAWTKSVAGAVDAVTRKPRFDAIFVPAPDADGVTVGKATAQIVMWAHQVGRTLRAFIPVRAKGSRLHKIVGANTVNQESWKSGWVLTIERSAR